MTFSRPTSRTLVHYLIATVVFAGTGMLGWQLRWRMFDVARPIRYGGDLENAYRHGTNVIRLAREQDRLPPESVPSWPATGRAYLAFYDRVLGGWPERGYELDYPPLRLAVMTVWSRAIYPDRPRAVDELPACRPLLVLNALVAAVAAGLAGMLTAHWVRRAAPAGSRRPLWCGVTAAVLLWLNFAVLIDAHAWPQWDVWLLPFFLGSMWAASGRRWLTSGLVFGLGAMFKGQLLVVAPVLILWPLLAGWWRGTARVLIGLAAAVAVVESLWILVSPMALLLTLILLGGLTAAAIHWRRLVRGRVDWLIGTAVLLTLAAAYLGGASFGWVKQGFVYGAERSTSSLAAPGANNLGQLLQKRFGWDSAHEAAFGSVSLGTAMKTGYGLCLLACSIALARHDRRNDVRALAAMAAPWVVFFALMPQLSGRYLVWGAAVTALLAGIDLGAVLLHLVISAISGFTILLVLILYSHNATWWPALTSLVVNSHPDVAWATLLCAGIMMFLACSRTSRPAL